MGNVIVAIARSVQQMILYAIRVLPTIWKFIFLYTGVGYIIHMIHRPENERTYGTRPSNFLLWLIGIYAGAYSLAYVRYENRMNRLYSIFSAYGEHIDYKEDSQILQSFIDLQNEKVPLEPDIKNPFSVVKSLLEIYNTQNEIIPEIAVLSSQYFPFIEDLDISGGDFSSTRITLEVDSGESKSFYQSRFGQLMSFYKAGYIYFDSIQADKVILGFYPLRTVPIMSSGVDIDRSKLNSISIEWYGYNHYLESALSITDSHIKEIDIKYSFIEYEYTLWGNKIKNMNINGSYVIGEEELPMRYWLENKKLHREQGSFDIFDYDSINFTIRGDSVNIEYSIVDLATLEFDYFNIRNSFFKNCIFKVDDVSSFKYDSMSFFYDSFILFKEDTFGIHNIKKEELPEFLFKDEWDSLKLQWNPSHLERFQPSNVDWHDLTKRMN